MILNNALVEGKERGYIVAIDVSDPEHPLKAWRAPIIDINPGLGSPMEPTCPQAWGWPWTRQRRCPAVTPCSS
ncbi:MAG: hypothetical protein ABI606_11235 [Rhodoferax sp.]